MMLLDTLGFELLGSLLEMASTMKEEAQNSLQKERFHGINFLRVDYLICRFHEIKTLKVDLQRRKKKQIDNEDGGGKREEMQSPMKMEDREDEFDACVTSASAHHRSLFGGDLVLLVVVFSLTFSPSK
ncbi:unnamed protein product [Lactuca virosa]|uniref:Uncharacterized protein n=1 Tax=Lactuca virosa TaxID=75947 RepID=A0AAU9P4R5_9ASTR|nr:unnamed protein product [Lactuca virosa]